MHGATIQINICAVGMVRQSDNFCAKLFKNKWGYFISGPIGAIQNDFQAIQIQLLGKGVLQINDITTVSMINKTDISNILSGRQYSSKILRAEHGLDFLFN